MSKRAAAEPEVSLEKPSSHWQAEFLEAVRRSKKLHGRWVAPPRTAETYRELLARSRRKTHFSHFVCGPAGELVGVINISEVVRGSFESGYLGYYAFAPHAGRGFMRAALNTFAFEP